VSPPSGWTFLQAADDLLFGRSPVDEIKAATPIAGGADRVPVAFLWAMIERECAVLSRLVPLALCQSHGNSASR
jgi:hypothetical protein